MRRRAPMVPMRREEHEAAESVVREVFDEQSGRYRLVKGSGEIIERIVTKAQHSEINKNATLFDGVHGASQAQAMARRS